MSDAKHTLLISIRPRYADMIFSGRKSIELRKVRSQVGAGDRVLVYVSSPVKALVGAFVVASVVESSPATIWQRFGGLSGLKPEEFFGYFSERRVGFGLVIARAWRFRRPLTLAKLRQQTAGFHPPQVHQYVPPHVVQAYDPSLAEEPAQA